jgi:hypothetical protein
VHGRRATLYGTVDVKPDPRASWTQAQYLARHAFLRALYDEVSSIDRALNELDARRKTAGAAERERLDKVAATLSSNPRNSEDDLWRPDRLRERVQTLIGVLALSQGPPTEAQSREAGEIGAEFKAVTATYPSYFSHEGLR